MYSAQQDFPVVHNKCIFLKGMYENMKEQNNYFKI